MTLINGIFVGLIQGVGDFLPISASAHASILKNLFGLAVADESHALMNVLLHLAGLIAICVVYRDMLSDLFNDCITTFTTTDKKLRRKAQPGARQVLMLLISTLPLLVLLPFYNAITRLQNYTILVGVMMVLMGFVLNVADQFLPGKKNGKTITVFDALVIGVCQCVGMLPGMSRLGTAFAAALCCGVDKEYAVKYSLLLGLPAMLGGTVVSFVSLFQNGVDVQYVPAYLIGTSVALVAGVMVIGLLQLLAKLGTLGKFRYYCWGAGVIAVILTAIL